jgi:hypothetical protein
MQAASATTDTKAGGDHERDRAAGDRQRVSSLSEDSDQALVSQARKMLAAYIERVVKR